MKCGGKPTSTGKGTNGQMITGSSTLRNKKGEWGGGGQMAFSSPLKALGKKWRGEQRTGAGLTGR